MLYPQSMFRAKNKKKYQNSLFEKCHFYSGYNRCILHMRAIIMLCLFFNASSDLHLTTLMRKIFYCDVLCYVCSF